jgi:hypothetical protein
MIDPRTQELIEANLEGTLSGPELAELNRRLLGSPETRALRDDLKHVDALLRALPAETPPAGLLDAVLQRAPQPAREGAAGDPARRPFARIAAGFAGGALVTAALFQALTLHHDGVAPEQVIGTMASQNDAGGRHLATVRLSGASADGSAALYQAGSSLWLELRVASDRPWELEASYDPAVIDFQGLRRPLAESEPLIQVADGSIRVSGTEGEATYRLELKGVGQSPAAIRNADIRLALNVSGQPVAESVLSVPGEER